MRDLSRLVSLLPGRPEVTVASAGDFARVTAAWPEGARLKLDVHADHVDWKDLASGDRRGLYGELCDVLPAYFARLGLDYMKMTPADGEARDRLLRRGDWQAQDDGSYRWAVR